MDFYYDVKKKVKNTVISQEEFMDFKYDTYDVLGSVFLRELKTVRQVAENVVIENEFRFDLIAYKQMRTTDYWWIIMEYNDYMDFNIVTGDRLKIPNAVGINKLIHKLTIRKNANALS